MKRVGISVPCAFILALTVRTPQRKRQDDWPHSDATAGEFHQRGQRRRDLRPALPNAWRENGSRRPGRQTALFHPGFELGLLSPVSCPRAEASTLISRARFVPREPSSTPPNAEFKCQQQSSKLISGHARALEVPFKSFPNVKCRTEGTNFQSQHCSPAVWRGGES